VVDEEDEEKKRRKIKKKKRVTKMDRGVFTARGHS